MINAFSKEFTYYGKRMRPYYKIWGFAVSEDGKIVLRHYENDFGSGIISKRPPKKLTVKIDKEGNTYVQTRDYGNIMIAPMVASCFCPPCPFPQTEYEIVHKDGRPDNCHYTNLEWRKKLPVATVTLHTTAKSIKLANGLTVHKDGSVYDKRERLTLSISHYDPDTNLEWSHTPKVFFYRPNRWKRMEIRSLEMDSLMVVAGYVGGEKSTFPNPCVLHKDNDWLNFQSDNLEWCDRDDSRYLEYIKKRTEDMNACDKANNKDFPDMWLR